MPIFWDKLAVMCNESNILTNSRNVVSNTFPSSSSNCFLSDYIFNKFSVHMSDIFNVIAPITYPTNILLTDLAYSYRS